MVEGDSLKNVQSRLACNIKQKFRNLKIKSWNSRKRIDLTSI